jgi:hypothetical protein
VVERVAHVATGGDEPVGPAAWLRRQGGWGERAAGGGCWDHAPARGRGAGGEAGEAESHLVRERNACFVRCLSGRFGSEPPAIRLRPARLIPPFLFFF